MRTSLALGERPSDASCAGPMRGSARHHAASSAVRASHKPGGGYVSEGSHRSPAPLTPGPAEGTRRGRCCNQFLRHELLSLLCCSAVCTFVSLGLDTLQRRNPISCLIAQPPTTCKPVHHKIPCGRQATAPCRARSRAASAPARRHSACRDQEQACRCDEDHVHCQRWVCAGPSPTCHTGQEPGSADTGP